MNITCSALPENAARERAVRARARRVHRRAIGRSAGCSRRPTAARCSSTKSARWCRGLQAKLLRFLEEKTFKRVGGSADIHVDVRVIAATNREPRGGSAAAAVPRGSVLPAQRHADRAAAAARARRATSRCCVDFYIDSYNARVQEARRGRRRPTRWRGLQAYGWPGNIRELRNAVERAMLLAEGESLTPTISR